MFHSVDTESMNITREYYQLWLEARSIKNTSEDFLALSSLAIDDIELWESCNEETTLPPTTTESTSTTTAQLPSVSILPV